MTVRNPIRSTIRGALRGDLDGLFGDNNPLAIVAPGFIIDEDDLPYDISAANSTLVVASDADAGGGDFTWTIAVTGDGTPTMSLTDLGGLAFSVGDGTDDADMTFAATVAEFNTAMDGATVTQGTPGAGSVSMAYQMTDGTNTANATAVATITANDFLLLEAGDWLLLESGDRFSLEA